MNKEDVEKIQEVIDKIHSVCNTREIMIANNENHAKKLRELFPGIEVILRPSAAINSVESKDAVYIIPAEHRPIKFIYQD